MSNSNDTVSQRIEEYFDGIENEIFSGDLFSEWRGAFEVKNITVKKESANVNCDLEIRLNHWPDGLIVKVYKHKALGVLPFIKDYDICKTYIKAEPVPCKFWKDAFYFSHMENLDSERYVLLEGDEMSDDEYKTCLNKTKMHIEEINVIIAARGNV